MAKNIEPAHFHGKLKLCYKNHKTGPKVETGKLCNECSNSLWVKGPWPLFSKMAVSGNTRRFNRGNKN